MIAFIVGLLLGSVAGLLVYRNNSQRLEREATEARADYEAALSKTKRELSELRERLRG